jgi:hypothetical protein
VSVPYYSVRGLIGGRELGRALDPARDRQLVVNESPLDPRVMVLTFFDLRGGFLGTHVLPASSAGCGDSPDCHDYDALLRVSLGQ